LSVWPGEVHGEYIVATTYHLLCSSEFKESHDLWIKIWKFQVQERIKFFQWLAIHGRLMTNFQKYVMRLGSSCCCNLCGGVRNYFRCSAGCPYVMVLWLNLQIKDNFFAGELLQWIKFNSIYTSLDTTVLLNKELTT
jgi:hypothetical protein